MKWIKEKRVELQRIIDNINECYTTNNRNGFTFNCSNGVIWSETRRGKKWGKAFEEGKRFYAIIDLPPGSYEIDELVTRIKLNERKVDEQVSGIRLRKDKLYDSVQISIYNDRATTYSFNNEEFINFVNEVASRVIVK